MTILDSNKKSDYKFDKNNFQPNTTYETIYPWSDVMACFSNVLGSTLSKNSKCCPLCNANSSKLTLIMFKSPDWTWMNLCGTEGLLSICAKCKIQVEYFEYCRG